MSLTPQDREELLGFEVSAYEGGALVQSQVFDTLQEAEQFAETWTEQMPSARIEIEDRTRDHTAWEAVEADTALEDEYPPGIGE